MNMNESECMKQSNGHLKIDVDVLLRGSTVAVAVRPMSLPTSLPLFVVTARDEELECGRGRGRGRESVSKTQEREGDRERERERERGRERERDAGGRVMPMRSK